MLKRFFAVLMVIITLATTAQISGQSNRLTLQPVKKHSPDIGWWRNSDKSCEIIETKDGGIIATGINWNYGPQNATARGSITIFPYPTKKGFFTEENYVTAPASVPSPHEGSAFPSLTALGNNTPLRGYHVFPAICGDAAKRDLPPEVKAKFHKLFGIE